ncbi:unnamed protein product [Leptosia nina]|uniref:Mitochondrial transcription rescue factor 1 C-terminal domain-containing protein n=1 Tax=Leptosia nina TaxID=320188 RepID=A0AAV1J6L7_9NEOP
MNCIWRRNVQRFVGLAYCNLQNSKRKSIHLATFSTIQSSLNKPFLLSPVHCTYSVIRQKSKKKRDIDSDDEEELYEGDGSLSKDSKVIKVNTTSLRTDGVLKLALGVSRNKIEQLFYESKIRVNGKKLLKKSNPVQVDNEIDVIKGLSPKNPDHILVSRVEVLNIAAREESIAITVRRFKNLLIENYEKDPYKPSSSEEQE